MWLSIKDLNSICWNNKAPKYDIREWSPDHSKIRKGVTLSKEELWNLRDVLGGLSIGM